MYVEQTKAYEKLRKYWVAVLILKQTINLPYHTPKSIHHHRHKYKIIQMKVISPSRSIIYLCVTGKLTKKNKNKFFLELLDKYISRT